MDDNIKISDVEELYKLLGISQKSDELKEDLSFGIQENDEHLAWKPLTV